jgi:hypothetical protein
MKTKIMIALVMGFIMVASTGFGQTRADRRQKSQRVRIAEGRKDGEVTTGEAAVLKSEQRHIRRSERRAKADGTVTPKEKLRLERKQNRASRHIHRAKNNPIDSK